MGKEMNISPETVTAIARETVDQIHAAGLVMVPEEWFQGLSAKEKQKVKLMKMKAVTAVQIDKYNLLNGRSGKGVTRKTVMNMIADGRIHAHEHFKDENDITRVLTSAIRRLNGE